MRPWIARHSSPLRIILPIIILALTDPPLVFSEVGNSHRPLLMPKDPWQSVLPMNTHLLIERGQIEQFLDALDGAPPDWAAVYGRGHHDPSLDDRLFDLNRDRDGKREGNLALRWPLTFLWFGELSDYDPETGGFRIAVGPTLTATRWGIVRFKPENLPENLMAMPGQTSREELRLRIEQGRRVEVQVLFTGRLIPQESVIYDFSHDEPGRGVIMPVVRVEQVDFVLLQ